ncbi:hypothetical protein H6G97_14555 [Nostoc flagelliforme FACHB-838]|uniref:Transposase n=1 Tax=Nostoc flagelliforme FACHB-838 TaxID=2692904 RepID=A0ABR8DRA9_9NOSO|nr:hypothetical protein [Nostoc flagelliforme]MBD2530730.1 hypothetical protein [Nostoc flagelliforme FACHB-838]
MSFLSVAIAYGTHLLPHNYLSYLLSRVKNEVGKLLGKFLDTEKAASKPIKLVRLPSAPKLLSSC